jgi:EAL domain-containing protein (putative c-di-GMP-specific phosphodiesterase class I)
MIDLELIKAGLQNGEFSLEYMPIICLDSKRYVGVEALVRWQYPGVSFSPMTFYR